MPAEWYSCSPRPYPDRLPAVDYPLGFWTYLIPKNGILAWRGQTLYISTCLANEYVGMTEEDEEVWGVYYCSTRLGRIQRDTKSEKRFRFVREKFAAPRATTSFMEQPPSETPRQQQTEELVIPF